MTDIEITKLIRSRRRTLVLEVAPDAGLIVRAPLRAPMGFIRDFIFQKRFWIRDRIEEAKEQKEKILSMREAEGEMLPGRYRQEARRIILPRVRWHAERLGLIYHGAKITSAKKRWGSCSAKGRLCFSWRLVLAPLAVIDYVVLHELAHLEIRDHSRKFWDKMASMLPDYKVHRRWLRDNAHLLKL
jgi:predicted metal-dependent hydrolase